MSNLIPLRRTTERRAIVAAQFDNAAVGREVASKNHDTAGRFQRSRRRTDYRLARSLGRAGGFLRECLAGDGGRVAV